MKVKVLTMTGGEYVFDDAVEGSYKNDGTVFRVTFYENGKKKNKDFPVRNIESLETEDE